MLTSAAYWIDCLRKLIFFSDLVCQFCILYSVTIVQLFFLRFIALNLFQTIFLHCKHVVSILYLFYFCLFILFCVCIVFILFCDILLKFHAIDTFWLLENLIRQHILPELQSVFPASMLDMEIQEQMGWRHLCHFFSRPCICAELQKHSSSGLI